MKNIKWLLFLLFLFFNTRKTFSQITKVENTVLNFNSDDFIRIFDGFSIPEGEAVPRIKINKIIRTSDSTRLAGLMLKGTSKPFMIMSSEVDDFRRFVYDKARLGQGFEDLNIPIILNNELVTFDKYELFQKINRKAVVKVEYRSDMRQYNKKYILPFGVIEVRLICKCP